MGLFSKGCVICDGKCGLTSSKSIADGKLCENCISELSPWFTDFKHATAESIEEQMAYREENKKKLDDFEITKAWGIKKYKEAMQFIYDKDKKQFVVVSGPEETFKERNPDVIDFDQVTDVFLEVIEHWGEKGGQYDPPNLTHQIRQEEYKDVFWRYDFYLHIKVDHPYFDEICYKMNWKTTVLKVPQRGIMFRRGLEMSGTYKGEELESLAENIEKTGSGERRMIKVGKVVDTALLKKKDDDVVDLLIEDYKDEKYLKKIENVANHIKRADRIYKLLVG